MKYLTTKKAARMLDVTRRSISYHIKTGHIINAKRCGCERNNWLVSEDEILKMVKMPNVISSNQET